MTMSPSEKLPMLTNETVARLYQHAVRAIEGLQPLVSRGLVSHEAGKEVLDTVDALRGEITNRGGYLSPSGQVHWT